MVSTRRSYSSGLKLATGILIFLLIFVPSKSVTVVVEGEALKQREQMLGSRPPMCINKCYSCRPCRATLVIPPHGKRSSKLLTSSSSLTEQDDTYYHLTWKCRCGNKIYQP